MSNMITADTTDTTDTTTSRSGDINNTTRNCLAVVEVNDINRNTSSNDNNLLLLDLFDGCRRVRLKLPPLQLPSHDEDEDDDDEKIQLLDLKRMIVKSLNLPLLLLSDDDDEKEGKDEDEDEGKDDVDDDDDTKDSSTTTIKTKTKTEPIIPPITIKASTDDMIIELYNSRKEIFHLLRSIHDIPSKCCRLRISIIIGNNNNNNNKDNDKTNTETTIASCTTTTQHQQTPLLALPWREYSYGTSIDKDGSFVVNSGGGGKDNKKSYPIRINEISNSGLGTGTNIWDGAIALTKFLEYYDNQNNNKCDNDNDNDNNDNDNNDNDNNSNDNSNDYIVRNKNILELGSGTGFVGISCYVAFQSKNVIVTDIDYSMENLKQNIIININTTNTIADSTNNTIADCNTNTNTIKDDDDDDDAEKNGIISAEILDWYDYKNTCDKIFFQNSNSNSNSINNEEENWHHHHHHQQKVEVEVEVEDNRIWIPDIILAADVVWVDSLVRPLVETFYYICTFCIKHKHKHKQQQQQQSSLSPIILLSYQRRSQIVENNLFNTLKEYHFHYEDVTTDTNTNTNANTNTTAGTAKNNNNNSAKQKVVDQQQQQQQKQQIQKQKQQKIRIYKITYIDPSK